MAEREDRQRHEETPYRDAGRKPDYIGFSVKDRGPDQDAVWTRLGAAWAHKDGQGYDIQMDAIPVDGRLTLREFRERRQSSTREDHRDRGPSRER